MVVAFKNSMRTPPKTNISFFFFTLSHSYCVSLYLFGLHLSSWRSLFSSKIFLWIFQLSMVVAFKNSMRTLPKTNISFFFFTLSHSYCVSLYLFRLHLSSWRSLFSVFLAYSGTYTKWPNMALCLLQLSTRPNDLSFFFFLLFFSFSVFHTPCITSH